MQNIFIELLPPWVETGLQPAFYDKESGTVLQQVSRMWAKMIELGAGFNKFTEDTADTVNTYIQKFVELYNYVHDYFDNLDVQEEINNKLDDMVEAGTLQEIITEYIQSNVAWTFDTVAEMKLAINLVDGSYVRTLGFYSLGDGGGALYKISDSGTANEMDVIAVDNLYATLVDEGCIKPDQVGAYGDGTHDDSTAIQRAFDLGKVVEFNNKTYLCFALTCNYDDKTLVINGNGATLKRPDLSAEPYNKTPQQMKWIQTIVVNSDCEIYNLNFDNNCFEMWSPADGYAQEQACSVIVRNQTKEIKFLIDGCNFKNSAGDGLHIVENVTATVSNCTSTDCFRGGLTSTGYGSEINVNNWDSKTVTSDVPDGFDVEVDTVSTVAPQKYILNMNNIVLDYDLDISTPNYGQINLNNINMREFNSNSLHGFMLGSRGGVININNSVLRAGKLGSVQTFIHDNGVVKYNNCKFIGNASEPVLKVTQYQETLNDSKLIITNCEAKDIVNFLQCASFFGTIVIDGCNIECSGELAINISPNAFQVSKGFHLENSYIACGSRLMTYAKNQYAPNGSSKLYLSNLRIFGDTDCDIRFNGNVEIFYDSLVLESCILWTKTSGSHPKFYGDNRVILVDTATDLDFQGWVAGSDIAIAKDTGTRYRYTTGTTWTAIA